MRYGKVQLVIKGGNDKSTNQPLKVLLLDQDDKKPAGDNTDPDDEDP
jgi:hypothetical protein